MSAYKFPVALRVAFRITALSILTLYPISSFADLVHDAQAPAPYEAHINLAAPFQSVGAVILNSVSDYQIPASGVLIAPKKVLTAAHNLFDYELQPAASMSFSVGQDVLGSPLQTVQVVSWTIHPNYYGIGGPADLAVLTLGHPINAVAPASLWMGDFVLGSQVVMVGYGRPGAISTGFQDEFDGIRRAGVLYPSEYGGGIWPQDYLSAWFFQVGWPYSHELGQLATPGDSGGGWFINNNGAWKLVAITVVNNGYYGYGGRTGANRLDGYNNYRDWVISQIGPKQIPQYSNVTTLKTIPVRMRPYP